MKILNIKKLILMAAVLLFVNAVATAAFDDPILDLPPPLTSFNCVHIYSETGASGVSQISHGVFYTSIGGFQGSQGFCESKFQEMLVAGSLSGGFEDHKGSCPECCVITYVPLN